MAKPTCLKCKKGTSSRGLEEREGMCARCFALSKLVPFDDAEAERLVRQEYRSSGLFDRVVAFMKRRMLPPPGSDEWKLHHVVELDSRRFTW